MNFKPLPRLPMVVGRERTHEDVALEFRWRAMNFAYWRVLEPHTPTGPRGMIGEESVWRRVYGEEAYKAIVDSGEKEGAERAEFELKRMREQAVNA